MTPFDLDDQEELRLLSALPAHEPVRPCRDRIRRRCHAALDAKQRKAASPPAWLESTLVAIASTGYLVEVLRRALTLYGL